MTSDFTLAPTGYSFDQWMNICGISGVLLTLFTYALAYNRPFWPLPPLARGARLAGFGMILAPLLLRWFFTREMLITAGVGIALLSAVKLYFRRE